MRTLEIILLILVLSGGVLGIRRGLVRELVGLAQALGAAWLARTFSGATGSLLSKVMDLGDGPRTAILTWIVGFLAIYVVLLVLLFLLRKVFRKLRFKGDTISGAVIGILRVAILLALLLPAVAWASGEDGSAYRAVTGIRPWGWLRNGAHRARETPFVPREYVKFVEDTPEIWQ